MNNSSTKDDKKKGLIMFKVPTNKRASNIGPYLNLNFSSPTFFSVCKLVIAVKLC